MKEPGSGEHLFSSMCLLTKPIPTVQNTFSNLKIKNLFKTIIREDFNKTLPE